MADRAAGAICEFTKARRRRREMHNVEGTVEDTKLIVTIDLAAITRDGHSRLLSTDCGGLAKNDPQATGRLDSPQDCTPPVG